jgi:hypothetical protein
MHEIRRKIAELEPGRITRVIEHVGGPCFGDATYQKVN